MLFLALLSANAAQAADDSVERHARHLGRAVPTVEEIVNSLRPPCGVLPGCTRNSATGVNEIKQPVEAAISSSLVTFETGSATLSAQATKVLDIFAKGLQDERTRSAAVTVEGHADKRGDDKLNTELSQGRAEAVVSYLAGKGVDKGRLKAVGKGAGFPMNLDDPADAANRRAEFVVAYPAGATLK